MTELAGEINATASTGEAPLAPGDTFDVRFSRLENWTQEGVVVGADGTAAFLLIDDRVQVASLTPSELDVVLTSAYAKELADSDLIIDVTARAPRTISVMGEVATAGRFELPPGRTTLLEGIALAGGFVRDTARPEHTILVRWLADEDRIQAWKMDASTSEWDGETSIVLQPHDVIFVPAKPVVHVNDWVDRYIIRNLPFPPVIGVGGGV